MWSILTPSILLVILVGRQGTEGTLCYQCDSWEHLGCGEDDYLYDKDREFLVPCNPLTYSQSSGQYQTAPQTCLKEVTYFLHDKNSPVLDPYHRYNRPHVMRHCGISLNPAYNRGEDYYDRCVKTEAVVNGIKAERWICSCSGDGCNSATRGVVTTVWIWCTALALLVTSGTLF
ncbi:uncharacterized protein LOC110858105 [Folsomia candida]|uniref:CRISPR-associated endoribonuclease Cas6 n=1 Tax=Folsomia candida TaxID=158441 RepID=A0A226DFU2_FOLCA|nr:uncharacterized protein LOC110858105 [Folsomia candida]OXA44049.1 CRISPR-associated endoribonuclease Cas6 [Folsomia candida]